MDTSAGNTIVAAGLELAESVAKKLLKEVVVKAVVKEIITAIPIFSSGDHP